MLLVKVIDVAAAKQIFCVKIVAKISDLKKKKKNPLLLYRISVHGQKEN